MLRRALRISIACVKIKWILLQLQIGMAAPRGGGYQDGNPHDGHATEGVDCGQRLGVIRVQPGLDVLDSVAEDGGAAGGTGMYFTRGQIIAMERDDPEGRMTLLKKYLEHEAPFEVRTSPHRVACPSLACPPPSTTSWPIVGRKQGLRLPHFIPLPHSPHPL